MELLEYENVTYDYNKTLYWNPKLQRYGSPLQYMYRTVLVQRNHTVLLDTSHTARERRGRVMSSEPIWIGGLPNSYRRHNNGSIDSHQSDQDFNHRLKVK